MTAVNYGSGIVQCRLIVTPIHKSTTVIISVVVKDLRLENKLQGQGQGLGPALIQTCNNMAQSKKSCHLLYIVVVMSQISNGLL